MKKAGDFNNFSLTFKKDLEYPVVPKKSNEGSGTNSSTKAGICVEIKLLQTLKPVWKKVLYKKKLKKKEVEKKFCAEKIDHNSSAGFH